MQRAGLGLLIAEGTQPSDERQGHHARHLYQRACRRVEEITSAVHDAGSHIFIQRTIQRK
jgi:N-ethylmaleimide reductase